jgi:ribonuclease P protein component
MERPLDKLKQRADFLAAAAGARASGAAFVLQARRRTESGSVRVGFTVSKKVGNAVERNRVRRRLREVVRLSAALEWPFQRLVAEFGRALHRVHARPPKGTGDAADGALHDPQRRPPRH